MSEEKSMSEKLNDMSKASANQWSVLVITLGEVQKTLVALRQTLEHETVILEARTPLFKQLLDKIEAEDRLLASRTDLFQQIIRSLSKENEMLTTRTSLFVEINEKLDRLLER